MVTNLGRPKGEKDEGYTKMRVFMKKKRGKLYLAGGGIKKENRENASGT